MKRLLVFIFLTCSHEKAFSSLEFQAQKNPQTSYFHLTPNINVVTGENHVEECDLIVAGAQPLSLRRFYGQFGPFQERYTFWRFNPEQFMIANFEYQDIDRFVAIGESDGSVNKFDGTSFSFKQHSHNYCHVNSSGQRHPFNTKVTHFKEETHLNIRRPHFFMYKGTVTDGSGRVRIFCTHWYNWLRDKFYHTGEYERSYGPPSAEYTPVMEAIPPSYWTPYEALIIEERLPNGNVICYTYDYKCPDSDFPSKNSLKRIEAYNSTRTKLLASLQFEEGVNGFSVVGSDQRKCTFKYGTNTLPYITSAVRPGQPDITYEHEKKNAPYMRFIYSPKGKVLQTEHDKSTSQVSYQMAPVGMGGAFCKIGQYYYDKNKTNVIDAEGNWTSYTYDDKSRITKIEHYEKTTVYSVEKFSWNPASGSLLSHSLEDPQGHLALMKTYRYDKCQNVIEEHLGDGKESYATFYTYSDDGFNLRLSQEDTLGKKTTYEYLPNTNLLSKELVYEGSKIRKRIFHFYDDCAICIKTIVDDGASISADDIGSVTYRKITIINPKQTHPCFGLPESIEEKTIDQTGQEILLSKAVYTYHPSGKVLKEERYDAHGALRYTLSNVYDDKERLIATTNAIGEMQTFTYDGAFNLTAMSGPRPDMKTEIVYDIVNRPVKITLYQKEGAPLMKERQYDKLGRVVVEKDFSGLETKFEYNAAGHVCKIIHPDGAVEQKEYDLLGNPIKEVDPLGFEIGRTFSFHSKPLDIYYPDQSKEHFTYNGDGTVATHADKNGAIHHYVYDIFGHIIETKSYDHKGHLLKQTKATFSPFAELSKTDGNGIVTKYGYDFAGRKISEEKGATKTTYSYDALGRLTTTTIGNTAYIKEYDLLNREVCARVEDEHHILLREEYYQYDEAGNKVATHYFDGTQHQFYDVLGRTVKEVDALGQVSSTEYIYNRGLTIKNTDPAGKVTLIKHDTRERPIEVTTLDQAGNAIQKCETKYDLCGNAVEVTHHVFEGANFLKTITHRWVYGPMKQIEKVIEAGKKETGYLYEKGHLTTLVKPDGTTIHHQYDELGRLKRYFASDFDYNYLYDGNDQLIEVYDEKTHMRTARQYCPEGYLILETLTNALELKSDYDPSGKRVALHMPKENVAYTYKGDLLHTISYKGLNYCYATRDLRGKVTSIDLPQKLGTITIERDALSRWKKYRSPGYSASNFEYDNLGNLTHYDFEDEYGKEIRTYEYDSLDQLTCENGYFYTCDSLYNRLKKNESLYDVNDLGQTLSDGEKKYEYDLNGNLLFDGKIRYRYDTQDRLISVTEEGHTVEYTYDPFHRRMTKSLSETGEIFKYLWDGDKEIGEYDTWLTPCNVRILGEGLGGEIGAAVIFDLNGYLTMPFHDHRGCVVALRGSLKDSYRYCAFGKLEFGGKRSSPWLFSSKRYDPETGFYYFGRRYYSPCLGKWVTPDPQGFDDGPNLYAYVHNNPLGYYDIYGQWRNPLDTKNVAEGLREVWNIAWCGIEMVGQHLIPIPGVRDVVESLGRWGQGGRLIDKCQHQLNYNRIHVLPGEKLEGATTATANGMLVTFEEGVRVGQKRQQELGNYEHTLLYNGTKGFLTDLIACVIAKLGLIMPYEKMCASYCKEKWEENPNHAFYIFAHSQAAAHIYNLGHIITPEQRMQMEVTTFGGATLIQEGFFKETTNFVSVFDLVPLTSPFRYMKALIRPHSNVHFLKNFTSNPLKEHAIEGKTYEIATINFIKQLQQR